MYHPNQCDYRDCEWIELYNNGTSTIDLTNWKIDNYNFDNVNISVGEYLVIARELIDGGDVDNESFEYYWGNNDKIWNLSDGNYSAVDGYFSLSDTTDTINLSNGTYSIILNYEDDWGADGDGNSLQLINQTWYASTPTPGYENSYETEEEPEEPEENQTNITGKDLEITVNLDDILDLFVEYISLFKIKNLDHESGIIDYINVTSFYNISKNNTLIKEDIFDLVNLNSFKTSNTGNIIFNETGNYTLCGKIINTTETNYDETNDFVCENRLVIDTRTIPCNISISIDLVNENLYYNNKQQIKFYNLLTNESFLYKIEYWIEDLFGNEIKKKYNTSNTNQKSWTPNIDESDQVFLIKNRISELYCNNSNQNINSERLIVVKGEKEYNSTINITKVYLGSDNKAKFGESLRVRVNIYKGDETKNNVKLWLEKSGKKISKVTSTNLYTDFINYDLTLAVQINSNCNKKYSDGTYTLFLTAFDKTDSITIQISGITSSLCKTIKSSSSSGTSAIAKTSKPFYEIISIPKEVNLNQEFSSKIRLNNNDKTDNKYSVWSYVYRGSKCYSGEREQNLQQLTIPTKSSAVIELKNIALEKGDFKFKIKTRKNDLKTTKDITESINVISLEEEKQKEEIEESKEEKETTLAKSDSGRVFLSEKEPKTIYLSSSAKARDLVSFFILFLISFLLISFIWKKTI